MCVCRVYVMLLKLCCPNLGFFLALSSCCQHLPVPKTTVLNSEPLQHVLCSRNTQEIALQNANFLKSWIPAGGLSFCGQYLVSSSRSTVVYLVSLQRAKRAATNLSTSLFVSKQNLKSYFLRLTIERPRRLLASRLRKFSDALPMVSRQGRGA